MIRLAIVDDHKIVGAGLRSMLEPEPDFEIVGEAASADDFETKVGWWQPNMILLDARLPGTPGAEATRRLTAWYPEVKVLIVSTYSDYALVDECIQAGAAGYVIKDIERFELKRGIRTVYNG